MFDCNSSGVLQIIFLIKRLLTVIQYAVPIILILISMIDILKLVFSANIEIGKTLSKIIKRIILAICVFLILPILNFIMDLLGKTSLESSQCWKDANEETIAKKKMEEEEKEKEEALKRQQDAAKLAAEIEAALKKRKEIVWHKPEEGSTEIEDFPYYNQGTPPWNTVPFCGGAKVGDSGCGATSLAMIFSGVSKKEATPEAVANWMCSHGHPGGAMYDSMAMNPDLLDNFHVKGRILWARGNAPSKESVKSQMIENVKKGKGLLVLIPGHFVAVIKGKEKDFYLLDPGSREHVGEYSAEELYNTLYDYKGRCTFQGDCGVKAVWAYEKE